MKAEDVPRRRVHNSRLTGERFGAPVDVVRAHLGMQAQDYLPAKWSVGQRTQSIVDADVDAALASGEIVRTHVLRPTWHFVARDDLRWLLALTGPRVQQRNARRYQDLGLDSEALARCERLLMDALGGGSDLGRDEIGVMLTRNGVDANPSRLAFLLMHCELEALICSAGPPGRYPRYALVDERVPKENGFDREGALVELVRRYLSSHGPATVNDLRWWSSLTLTDIKRALEHLRDEVTNAHVDGLSLWSMRTDTPPPPARAVQLLQAYDELIVGYTESRFFGDPIASIARAAWKDRMLPMGIALEGGRVLGHWRRTKSKSSIVVEVVTYEEMTTGTRRALQAAVAELSRFIGTPATIEASRA